MASCYSQESSTNQVPTGSSTPQLRDQILAKAFEGLGNRNQRIVSRTNLEELLNSDCIERELRNHDLATLASYVLRRARKIFAILLLIRKLQALAGFVEGGLDDNLLPLSDSAFDPLEKSGVLSASREWNIEARQVFLEHQWTVLAPVFLEGSHLKLANDAILPITEIRAIAKGADSDVYLIAIHRDYDSLVRQTAPASKQPRLYAMKQFSKGKENIHRRAFHQERAALMSLRSLGHSHLARMLASFEHQGQLSIIFPLAEGNLRQLWMSTVSSSSEVFWCLQEMTGVATALAHLHSSALAPDSRPLLGYHLDVKPENILIMNDEATGNRTWALSDFASSYFVPANAYDLLPPHPGLGTYEPPECQLNLPQSQAYDIWSLGCVFLECAAWLVEGSSAIHSFADDRLNDGGTTSGNIRDDYFFTLQYDHSMHAVGAVLRSAVTSWCLKIKSHRNSSRPIEQLVILIEKEFLLIDQTKRIASRQIGQCLQSISTEADKVNQSKIFEDEH